MVGGGELTRVRSTSGPDAIDKMLIDKISHQQMHAALGAGQNHPSTACSCPL